MSYGTWQHGIWLMSDGTRLMAQSTRQHGSSTTGSRVAVTWVFLSTICLQTSLAFIFTWKHFNMRTGDENWHLILFCHPCGFHNAHQSINLSSTRLDNGIVVVVTVLHCCATISSAICPAHYPHQALLHFFLQKHLSDPINPPTTVLTTLLLYRKHSYIKQLHSKYCWWIHQCTVLWHMKPI